MPKCGQYIIILAKMGSLRLKAFSENEIENIFPFEYRKVNLALSIPFKTKSLHDLKKQQL